MSNRPARNLFIVLMISMLEPRVASALGPPRDLLAHGSPQAYWIARVAISDNGALQTIIRARSIGGSDWKIIGRINGRVVSVTDRGRQLAVVLENGDWMLLSDNGTSSMGILPEDGSKLLMVAGGPDALWAVAAARRGRIPTTSGTTRPAAALNDNTLILTRLDRGQWTMLAPLPASAQQARDLSLLVSDDSVPRVAALLEDGQIHTYQWVDDRRAWEAGGVLRPTNAAFSRVKLLNDGSRVMLWSGDENGNGELFTIGPAAGAPIPLSLPAEVPQGAAHDVTFAGGAVRVLVSSADGRIVETSFSPDGTPQPPAQLPSPTPPVEEEPFNWLSAVIMTILLIVLLNTMRRGTATPQGQVEKPDLPLAPHGLRILAGAIDALPLICTVIIAAVRLQHHLSLATDAISTDLILEEMQNPFFIAVAIYILHTLVSEALWGWTIGKRLFGLRVATLSGTRPDLKSILVRNLFRAVDVAVWLLPIFLIFMLPLRQRVGDIAAETVVIRGPWREDDRKEGDKPDET